MAQQGGDCWDCADYKEAVVYLTTTRAIEEPVNESVVSAQTTVLYYHRRRLDPDSVLSAAQGLYHAAPKGSKASAFALYSLAESHLNLFEEKAYRESRALLENGTFHASLQPLINFYLLALNARYDYKFALNAERLTITLFTVIQQAEKYHPEMMREFIVTICEGYSYLGLVPVIMKEAKDYQARIKPLIKDELDAIIYQHGLARIYYFMGRFRRAGNMQEELISQLTDYPAKLPFLLANCHFYAAESCYKLHRDERCLPSYESAIKIRYSKDYVESLVGILYHTGQYDRVVEECHRFLSEAIPSFLPNSPLVQPTLEAEVMGGQYPGNLLMWKGRALYKKSLTKPNKEAVLLLESGFKSAELGRILHNLILFGADGYNISQMILNDQNTYGLGYQMRIAYQLWKRTGKHVYRKRFFHYMEMRKNFLLSEAFANDHLPPKEREALAKATRSVETYEFAFFQATPDSVQYFADGVLRESQELDRRIQEAKTRYPRQVMDHAQLTYADPDEIQRQLDDTTAFIVYTEQWNHFYVYAITSTSQRLIKVHEGPGMHEWIDDLIKSALSPLQAQRSRRDKFIERSSRIYNLFLKPIEQELAGKKRLIIVPEEHTGQIPFEILVQNDDKKPFQELDFLIKDFEISYYNSSTFYEKVRARKSIQNGSFLGFAPVFKEGVSIPKSERLSRIFMNRFYKEIRGKSFVSLPGTQREVATIADLLPPASQRTILLNNAATFPQLAKELRKDYQYIHIATHGLMSLFDPRRSAFACYDSRGENGDFLYAHYIESLNLHTDLAVLSSCESGLGIILEGESLIALSRSFLTAGAKNILYSLWQVDDQASSDLMISFYQGHLSGKSYTAALREAKLELLSNPNTAAPRLWGPFVLMGE